MQTSYTQSPQRAYPGQVADTMYNDKVGVIVEEPSGIAPGLLVVRASDDDTARLPSAVAADATAIVATFATSVAEQVLDTAGELDGAIGLGRISPPSKLTFVTSAHVDWDATSIVAVYENEYGEQVTESLAVSNGGGDTIKTAQYASRVVSITVPIQSGAGGTMTVGTGGVADRTLDGEALGVSIREHHGRRDLARTNTEVWEDEDSMPVMHTGRIAVTVENAYSRGDRVFVRLVAAGAEVIGGFRTSDTDGGDCLLWTAGRMTTSGAAGSIGILEVLPR